jgi:TolB-like protein/Flp pilus assembly protein TadD
VSAEKGATSVRAPSIPRVLLTRPLTAALAVGFLLGLGVLFGWLRSHTGAEPPAGERRVAVLPFENLGDSTDAYFADGITDAVRGKLTAIPGMRVTASNSSSQYRGTSKSPQEIGRELGVDYLLTGKVRWQKAKDGASRVQVSPELIEVASADAKWQQPFDAAITDVFEVQADIAGQVASALNVALGTDQKQTLTERPTENLAAYDAFLKGEASGGLTVGDPPTLRSAITYYEQAVALDSNIAEAWSRLSRAHSSYYYNVLPSPASAEAAKRAADRAMALAPKRAESLQAVGDYHNSVRGEYAEALAAYEEGLAASPENADLLTNAALAEQSLGRWDAAVKHLERARTLDPRSATTARRLTHTLLRLRRYPEALAAADRGLGVSPGNLDLIQNKAMVYLAQGDLDGARAAIRAAPAEVEPTALVSFFGNYWDLYWALDDAQQQLLLRLPLSAYDDDRGTWGIVRAQTHYQRGDRAKARVYADSARVGFERTLRATPDDPQRQVLLGLALAYLGRKAEATKAGERAAALLPPSADGYTGPYFQHQLARIYLLSGEPEKALDRLEPLLRIPYFLSPAWLRIDPTFDPLREHPRFRKLVER